MASHISPPCHQAQPLFRIITVTISSLRRRAVRPFLLTGTARDTGGRQGHGARRRVTLAIGVSFPMPLLPGARPGPAALLLHRRAERKMSRVAEPVNVRPLLYDLRNLG